MSSWIGGSANESREQFVTDAGTVVLLLLLGLVATGLIALRMRLSLSNVPLNYGEGWNAYHVLHYIETGTPYPPRDGLVLNNYPPLWFPVVALVGKATDSLVAAGRLVGTAGLALILVSAACIGGTLRGRIGALAALVSVAFMLSTQAQLFVGTCDPQFLAQGVSAFALLLAIRARDMRNRQYAVAIAVAVFAGFIKHNLAALPLALLVAAALDGRERFVKCSLAALGGLVVGYFVSAMVGGWSWPLQLLSPRGYYYGSVVNRTIPFLTNNAFGLALALAGLRGMKPGLARRILTLHLLFTLPIAIFFVGGEGVVENIFFDSVIAIGLCASLIVSTGGYFANAPSEPASAHTVPRWAGIAALSLWLGVSGLTEVKEKVFLLHHGEPLSSKIAQYEHDIAFLKSIPGAAICDQPALCYLAGKRFIYDPFNAGQALKTGRVSVARAREILLGSDIQAIHVSGPPPYPFVVPVAIADEVAANFSITEENGYGAFLVRRNAQKTSGRP